MPIYDENILHGLDGQKCTCTLHDIGYNCQRALTADSLRGAMTELIRLARLSGIEDAVIVTSFTNVLSQPIDEEESR